MNDCCALLIFLGRVLSVSELSIRFFKGTANTSHETSVKMRWLDALLVD